MLVTIVAVANKDNTGLDLDRLEKVEDLDPEIAQKMLDGGTGRVPSESELAAYRKTLNDRPRPAAGDADLPASTGPRIIAPPMPTSE